MFKPAFKSVFTITLLSLGLLSFGLSSNASALDFDEYNGSDFGGYSTYMPAEPPPRLYKSAQGYINIDSFEEFLSAQLSDLDVRILDIRWPYNPFDYTNYIISSAVETLSGDRSSKFGTYVVTLRIDGKHEGRCDLLLFPTAKKGRILNCTSTTAKLRLFHDFDFAVVGLR